MLATNPNIFNADFSAGSIIVPDTAIKIVSFEDLPVGWHYGDGGPIAKHLTDRALYFYWFLSSLGFGETDAFPGIAGEVMVTGYRDSHYVEVIAEIDDSVSIIYEQNGTEIYDEEHLEFNEAVELLRKISDDIRAGEVWNTLDFYTRNISIPTPTKTASKAWHLGTPMVVAFQLSSGDVLTMGVAPSAITQDNFTPIASQGILPYSGNLMSRSYRKEAF